MQNNGCWDDSMMDYARRKNDLKLIHLACMVAALALAALGCSLSGARAADPTSSVQVKPAKTASPGAGLNLAGTYSCRQCIADAWAQDFNGVGILPRHMGENQLSITLAADGLVSAGQIHFEVLGSPAGLNCAVGRLDYASTAADGAYNAGFNVLVVDFLGTMTLYGMSGQCTPEASQSHRHLRFTRDAAGSLLLCGNGSDIPQCLAAPVAILMKR
jgi:hypothetical protein